MPAYLNAVTMLLYRNLVASIDKVFLIWQIAFPIVYIFIAGYAYSAGYYQQPARTVNFSSAGHKMGF